VAITKAFNRRERDRQKESWRQSAFIAAQIINYSGRAKRKITPEQLVKFVDEKPEKIDIEKRRREALETLVEHKKRAWMKIGGPSLTDIKIYGEDDGKNS